MQHTLHIILEDLSKHRKQGLFKADHSVLIGLAGDPDGQAQWLKQVMVEMRLTGIL